MNRRDWYIWKLHIIKRNYNNPSQFGILFWKTNLEYWYVLDIWISQTLFTFRIM